MAKKNKARNSSHTRNDRNSKSLRDSYDTNSSAMSHDKNSHFFSKNGHKKVISTMLIAVCLIGLVSISGCVGAEFFDSIFGQVADFFGMDVIKTSRDVSSMGVVNPLVIGKVWTMPENKVIPEMPLSMFMEISNVDNDPVKSIETGVDIFDASLFMDRTGTKFCNEYEQNQKKTETCGPSQCGLAGNTPGPCVMKIGSTKQILFDLKAPKESAIAGVITKAKLNYKVLYDYQGATNFEVLIVDYQEIINRQKEGKTLSTNLIDTKGSGPIKIDVELGSPYIISKESGSNTSDSVKSKAYLTFKLRNAGAGALESSKIQANNLKILIPKAIVYAFTSPVATITDIEAPELRDPLTGTKYIPGFDCVADNTEYPDSFVCTNKCPIEFFKKESEPMQFIINNVAELPKGTPHKTYLISAKVKYEYELRGVAEVTVNPIMVR
ncbi:MAG: hypothetical protein V1870_04020 [Candidatus Aenigmatarchaeota archaeon]